MASLVSRIIPPIISQRIIDPNFVDNNGNELTLLICLLCLKCHLGIEVVEENDTNKRAKELLTKWKEELPPTNEFVQSWATWRFQEVRPRKRRTIYSGIFSVPFSSSIHTNSFYLFRERK